MIRKYQTIESVDVLNVWANASALAHPFLSEEFLELERRRISSVYLPASETWVWEADGRIVGFISLLGYEVGGIFVDPGFQGSGIGRALMDHALTLRGALEVEVFRQNLRGRAFYEKYGFTEIRRKLHAETGLEIIRLRLEANPPEQPDDFIHI